MSKTPFAQVESWLFELPVWKLELAAKQEQLHRIPGLTQRFELVAIYGQGQKNEAVLQEVIRRIQLQEVDIPVLELNVRLLDMAIQSLLPEEQQYIESRYLLKLPYLVVMERLRLTHRMYYNRRKQTLKKIYRFVGGDKSVLFVNRDEETSQDTNQICDCEEQGQPEGNK